MKESNNIKLLKTQRGMITWKCFQEEESFQLALERDKGQGQGMERVWTELDNEHKGDRRELGSWLWGQKAVLLWGLGQA
jgi:hypothetical protein